MPLLEREDRNATHDPIVMPRAAGINDRDPSDPATSVMPWEGPVSSPLRDRDHARSRMTRPQDQTGRSATSAWKARAPIAGAEEVAALQLASQD